MELIMKNNKLFYLLVSAVSLFGVFGCSNNDSPMSLEQNQMNKSAEVDYGSWNDNSGKIKFIVVTQEAYGPHNTMIAKVPDDYVLVGGGASVNYGSGWGALLVSSYPKDEALTTWEASSKEHRVGNPHALKVYAIGMKIDGVSRSTLRNSITCVSSKSVIASHPSMSVRLPDGYQLLGGGARIENSDGGRGSLLVASCFYGKYSWYAEAKDHMESNPAAVQAYAIGITTGDIPGFGLVSTINIMDSTYTRSSSYVQQSSVLSNYALTCVGGLATYKLSGRMLYSIYPSSDGRLVYAASKDHGEADGGFTASYYVAIKKL
jgi:hypothetical protein